MLNTLKALLLPHRSPAIRRRDKRFLWLSFWLGAGIAMAFGLSLYVLYQQRRF